MFAAHPLPSTPTTPFGRTGHYTPLRPSPLGPRCSNITTPPWTMGPPTRDAPVAKPGADENTKCSAVSFPSFSLHSDQSPQQHQQQQKSHTLLGGMTPTPAMQFPSHHQSSAPMSPTSPSPSPATPSARYANRYATQIANPLKTSSASLARTKTRKMFLNRVKNDRDAGRFEARGEQMMRMEHLAEKRRWETSMARDADGVVWRDQLLEEDEMLPDEGDVSALDEHLAQEEAMEQAFLETMDSAQHDFQAGRYGPQTEPNASFSDDEYEDIFNMLSHPPHSSHSSQDMDMS